LVLEPLLWLEESTDLYDISVSSTYLKDYSRHSSHHSTKKSGPDNVHPHLISNLLDTYTE
jgi:hypothetical protein